MLFIGTTAAHSADNDAPKVPNIIDTTVGSYPWFIALDQRCPEKNAERKAALEAMKQQLIAGARQVVAGATPEQATPILSYVSDVEKHGLPKSTLKEIDDKYFSKASAEEINASCASAVSDISQAMEVNRKLLEFSANMTQILEEAKSKSTQ